MRLVGVRSETAISNVKQLPIARKGNPIWATEVVRDNAQRAVARVEVVNVWLPTSLSAFAALISRADAVGRIGEPDRAIR